MKYLLIHSYSELNKGDAGIILATIQNIRFSDKDAKIYLYSTYSHRDKQFHSQKLFFEKYVDGIYPAIFPELFIFLNGKYYYGTIAKFLALFSNLIKSLFLIIHPSFAHKILSKEEIESYKAIDGSDFIISKGGSFLCNEGSMREFISLIRLFHPIYLAKRLKKRVIILGQSLGPVKGLYSQILFRHGISLVDDIYIRESRTLDLLSEDNIFLKNYKFVPDMAFALNDEDGIIDTDICFDNEFNVGLTIVDFPFKDPHERYQYIESMRNIITHLISSQKATIFIFPQVTTKHPDGSNDMRLTKTITSSLSQYYKNKTLVLEKDYSPTDLKKMYGMMDIFIATRLHSAIFALGNNIPTINISYHGTKSEGTFALLNLDMWVTSIHKVNSRALIDRVDSLISKRTEIKNHLMVFSKKLESDVKDVVNKICSNEDI